MPLINPDDIIKSNFKILSKKKQSAIITQNPKQAGSLEVQSHPDPKGFKPVKVQEPQPNNNNNDTIPIEEILARKVSSESFASTKYTHDQSRSFSNRVEYSVDVLDDKVEEKSPPIVDKNGIAPEAQTNNNNEETDNPPIIKVPEEDAKAKEKRFVKRKLDEEDRRRNAWIPCTCPQYKVSKELATKWDLQAFFFGKILVVKVVQLMIINLIVFCTVLEREATIDFFKKCHDWAYLSYGLFLALLVSIRWGVGYRSRWPMAASFIAMVPLTLIIAFITACIATIYNSIVIPLVTATIFLTFIMLCFAPYVLRRSVMHRAINVAGCALALLSSIVLLFLKEFEIRPISYWEFLSFVWLPGVLLSQIAVQITVFEIQRVIFGLCFNVSTKRWHVAALYI